jgi:gliding motility-associated-like protein
MTIEHFGVYNRFGQRIWTTFDQRRSWDGTQNGQLAEPGTYFFVLQYTCLSDGKKYIKKGDVILLQ